MIGNKSFVSEFYCRGIGEKSRMNEEFLKEKKADIPTWWKYRQEAARSPSGREWGVVVEMTPNARTRATGVSVEGTGLLLLQ